MWIVAGPPPAPYTGPVAGERNGARGAWWREGLRSWIPMLAIGATLLVSIQSPMLGMQRQIGDLRVEFRDVLRTELHNELTPIRRELAELRSRVEDVEVRLTRIESLVQGNSRTPAQSGSPGGSGAGQASSAD